MKRWVVLLLCLAVGGSCLGRFSCFWSERSADDIAVERSFQGDAGARLKSLEGEDSRANQTVRRPGGTEYTPKELYEAAVSYGYEGTYFDFLFEYFAEKRTEGAVARSLLSAVCISSGFTRTHRGFGFQTVTQAYSSAGAGVIYALDKQKGDAYIITNYHVVYDADSDEEDGISKKIQVYLYGQPKEGAEGIPAAYVGGSMTYDIAVLRIEGSALLQNSAAQAAELANSTEVAVGDVAIAIGNPSDGGISATRGIVSVDSEYIVMTAADGRSYVKFRVIRIDTPVNSGNSGGGLFSEDGKVIGIVNAKVTRSGIEGLAYAIPSNVAKYIADNLVIQYESGAKNGVVYRGILGITPEAAESYGAYDAVEGATYIVEKVRVAGITEGSLADGVLQKGDVIRAMTIGKKRHEIQRMFDATDLMLSCRAGSAVTVEFERNGKTRSHTFTLSEKDLVTVQ